MSETVRFHFDPLCPWAWRTSRWIREVAAIRDIDVEWRLFSLALANRKEGDPLRDVDANGTVALRTLALARREEGNEAVGRLYAAIGERAHEGELADLTAGLVRDALSEAGLDPDLAERATHDESTADDVRSEHEAAVTEVGAFGVPTVVLGSGRGIFGPVISVPLQGEEAGRMWDHVRWLTDRDDFFELKRPR